MIEVLSLLEFEKKVLQSDDLILVDFFANWCNPCKHMSSILDEILPEIGGTFTVYKVDVDKEPELTLQHNVTTIPTLFVYKNGDNKMIDPDVDTKEWLLESLKEWM